MKFAVGTTNSTWFAQIYNSWHYCHKGRTFLRQWNINIHVPEFFNFTEALPPPLLDKMEMFKIFREFRHNFLLLDVIWQCSYFYSIALTYKDVKIIAHSSALYDAYRLYKLWSEILFKGHQYYIEEKWYIAIIFILFFYWLPGKFAKWQ